MDRPKPVVPARAFARRALRLTPAVALLSVAACTHRPVRPRCARPVFLYTERVPGADGAIVERPVYGCTGADSVERERPAKRS